MKQEDLQNLLDSLDEGPLGKPAKYWDDLEKLDLARIVHMKKGHSKESKKKMSVIAKKRGNKRLCAPEIRAKAGNTMSKGIKAYTYPEMDIVGEYLNTREAGKALDMHPNMIAGVARGVHKSVRGYTFKYAK